VLFQSNSKGSAPYASRSPNDGEWIYKATPYTTRWGRVRFEAIELEEAEAVARGVGMVGPISQARLEGSRRDTSANSQWVIKPVDRAGSRRSRFCVDATTTRYITC